MSPMLEYVYQMTGIDAAYILIGMLVLILILFILVIVALCKLKKLHRRYDRFMRGKDAESMEDTILSCIEKNEKLDQMNQILREDIIGLRKNQRITYQKMGMVKYNAFREMSGDLSYALALLDQQNISLQIAPSLLPQAQSLSAFSRIAPPFSLPVLPAYWLLPGFPALRRYLSQRSPTDQDILH